MRQHEDGPWERLFAASDLWGVRRDGTLHQFVRDISRVPAWAALDRDDMRFAVPIEGHVTGVTTLLTRTVAWTREGAIFVFDRDEPPRELARLPGLAGVTAGIGSTYFAWLDDGRVMAHGANREWWQHYGGSRDTEWREITELRGARIFADAYHGCALFPDGRVACFGSAQGFSVPASRREHLGLTDVPALRGARTLHLEQNRSCGWMPRGRLVCVGTEGATGMPGIANDAQPAVLEVERLLQRAAPLR
jgi:hypothetical protein